MILRVSCGHFFALLTVFLLFAFKPESKQPKNIVLINVSLKAIPQEKKTEDKQKKKIPKKKTVIKKKKKTPKKKIIVKKKKKISKKKIIVKKKQDFKVRKTVKKDIIEKEKKKKMESKVKIQKKLAMEAAEKRIRMVSNKAQKNYLSKVQSILFNQWHQPTVGELQYLDDYADIKLTINKNGEIVSVVLAKKSADQAMNNSLKLLISELRKLPPFPAPLKKETITEIFRFRVEND